MAPTNKKRLRDNDQDSDSDYENERSYNCNNWPRFLVMESSNDDLPLSKLSPFAIQKGFQAVAGTLKSIKRLRDGSFLVECGKRAQAQNLLRTNIYRQTSQSHYWQDPELLSGSNQMSGPCWHDGGWDPGWTEGSGCGWGEPSDTEEGGEGDPHQHHFLDVWFPGTPEIDHCRLSKGEGGLVCS